MPFSCAPEEMLEELVGHETVVGRPNLSLIEAVADWLEGHGISCRILVGPEGDRANLFATIGDADRPGYVLSGHVDVVPAGEPEWQGDPFRLRRRDDRLIGRGACDMKGFVAAVLAAAPGLAEMRPAVPIHIALSYDEEAGCKGVPHMIAAMPELCAPPLGCIVGEPTGLVPVLAHKGKAALRLRAAGVAGHSSRPDLGANAIHALLPVLLAARAQAQALEAEGPRDDRFAPPWSSLQIGTVAGGQALNIIPERAEAEIEARAIAGVEPRSLLAPVIDAAEKAGVATEWLSSYPPLALDAGDPLATLVAEMSGKAPIAAVSFGTEAGLFQQAGMPAIICGPGDIARAHRPEEYLTRSELHACHAMILGLGQRCAA
ncbi:acetylornithine deacetylase [Roseovarius atlanticus]|uniref:acetylornithine deacetylase n=1 Tax=Roseovarius atlanticus TaxID=1641875 RepID=UPI001C949F64|nr:acetylornithine deacetylase [Roseovarius atlanticus]MBY5987750.1 acetylornithine deacetylase [Roseovarius atlanticus]MBY6123141.1 acetylornithine deacetylase [Roseovarius atlanticus]MBY6147637.1 acetylornithine deacetylase [Roseovarius atlanticus]